LVVVLVLVHVGSGAWLWAHGASAFEAFVWSRPLGDRVAVGGRYRVLVASGELWRLGTGALLHVDLGHLLVNVGAIVGLGRVIEPWLGPARVLGLFAAGGLGGAVAAQAAGVVASDGASGAAFAWLGAAVVLGARYRRAPGFADARAVGPVLWGMLGLNLVLSVALPFIDLAAHLGGLGVGLVVAGVERGRLPEPVWGLFGAGFFAVCAAGWLVG
jgi:membrane associated rhomboid family serine protease